ncbi:CsbD family protein [Nereida sp. MMG024]|nr:CsbD family protein [Nereida sp. MMG025]MCF6445856.1 CsbD family protein [Nereida sp. MMG025]
MNWDTIQGKWKQMKGDAKSEWAELTDDDIDRAEGDRDTLEGILQEKYGKTKEEVRDEVDQWMKKIS